VPVHQGHLELVLEVGHRAKPADRERRPHLAGEVDQQALEVPHLDARPLAGRQVAECLTHQRRALLEGEDRRLRGVDGHGDHQPVDELQAAYHQVQVPGGDRVEAAGVDRSAHGKGLRDCGLREVSHCRQPAAQDSASRSAR
jgi:hypothetical protein